MRAFLEMMRAALRHRVVAGFDGRLVIVASVLAGIVAGVWIVRRLGLG